MGRRRCRPLNQTRVVTGGRPRREMGTGEAAVPPRETSGRRYKALTPWRFQRGFVRKQAKSPAAAPRGRGGAPVGGSGAKRSRSASVVGSGGRSAGDGGARPSLPTWSLASPRPLHQATRARAPLAIPDLAAAEQDAVSLVRRVARVLNRRISDLVALLFRHKSAGIRASLPPRSLAKSSSSRTRDYSLHVSKDVIQPTTSGFSSL